MPGAVVHTNVIIGEGCIININTTIDHDTNLEEGVHAISDAIIRSHVVIHREALIGEGACVNTNSIVSAFYNLAALQLYKEEENETSI